MNVGKTYRRSFHTLKDAKKAVAELDIHRFPVAPGTHDQIAWAWAIVRETGYVDADVHDEDEADL